MWMMPETVKVFMATSPTDMRKSYNGLSILVESIIERDPLSGHLFVFFNRPRNRVKILWWHHGGFNLFCRRLERGRFGSSDMFCSETSSRVMSSVELAMILEGIDLKSARKRPRWVQKK
jgi:transposase